MHELLYGLTNNMIESRHQNEKEAAIKSDIHSLEEDIRSLQAEVARFVEASEAHEAAEHAAIQTPEQESPQCYEENPYLVFLKTLGTLKASTALLLVFLYFISTIQVEPIGTTTIPYDRFAKSPQLQNPDLIGIQASAPSELEDFTELDRLIAHINNTGKVPELEPSILDNHNPDLDTLETILCVVEEKGIQTNAQITEVTIEAKKFHKIVEEARLAIGYRAAGIH
jgi:hypothetical protein